ncbi:hypothetical protein PCANC_21041 [Puccinia coronata f. sp. avenae]|nr:hypothetical protein PCANC_21041 [Puccinia coronata f. sp. avenae]
MDHGLEILLPGSFFEPNLIHLSRIFGLINALLDLVDLYRFLGIFRDPLQEATRRCAFEASCPEFAISRLKCLQHLIKPSFSYYPGLPTRPVELEP